MRFVWISALKDLRRLRRDPMALAMWLALPVFVAVTMNFVFGRQAAAPQGRLLVADRDGSFLSGALPGMFNQGPLSRMVLVEKVNEDSGRLRLEKGDASALLIIPKGFGDAFLNNRPARLELITNRSQRILPGIIEEALSVLVEGSFYVQRLIGDQMRLVSGNGRPSETSIVEASVAINRAVRSVMRYLDPPLIELQTSVVSDEPKQKKSFGALFFPGVLFMALMFIAAGLAGDAWKERTRGTLRRVACTPSPIAAWTAGKALAAFTLVLAVAVLGMAAGGWLLGVSLSHALPAVLWAGGSGALLYLLMLFLATCASTERMATFLANLVLLPLTMIGGSFFPSEIMPSSFAAIGQWTPNGFLLGRFKAILDGGMTAGAIAAAFAGLALAAAVSFWLVVRRLRGTFLV
ncbi:MAG: ABC transporter permease [Acidobacteria bacterium]|nr:ABC transporter permease [Acidobacteriota bacterium]